ncbi:hypothetical protein GCM10010371_08400 [Streptomyces subrutilus]|uniref:DUF461 domain-containing protein n=1 Tax=Streptomyces subrutilus TaxID=36818 RepID=A0A5P2UR17_9ACTN|nr:DUF461 domain-containing protein [Streptomyces subrutilus]QEU80031.1 DUF461 domain-containing protein [Streptomyces subrutilus]GGZ51003.1 hypothetical protein GCM10010371_08400 [Streptomyces subrutilus]
MSRSLRRGALAATAVVFSIASLAACGAGNDAQTLQIKPDNAAITKGEIQIQNALVITQGTKDKKGPAAVSATVFNSGTKAETLDDIVVAGGRAKVVLKPAEGSGKITVPAGGSVVLGGKGNASAQIDEGAEAAKNGDAQDVVFKLSSTGDVALQAFVVPATGMYAAYGPTGAPASGATPSGGASGTPSGSASGTPSGAATGSPSGTPSGTASHAAGH